MSTAKQNRINIFKLAWIDNSLAVHHDNSWQVRGVYFTRAWKPTNSRTMWNPVQGLPPFACVRDPWKNHIHLRSCRWHFGGERLFRHWVQSSVSSAVLRSNSAWLWVAVRENINRSPTIRTTHTREMLFFFYQSHAIYLSHNVAKILTKCTSMNQSFFTSCGSYSLVS